MIHMIMIIKLDLGNDMNNTYYNLYWYDQYYMCKTIKLKNNNNNNNIILK